MSYLLLKLLHVASVVIFLGNILGGMFWAAHAIRTRDFVVIASTFEGIIRSDRLFTNPGVIGILVSGVAAAISAGFPILHTGWILWSIVLFSISGAAFGLRIAPLQRQLLALARSADRPDHAWVSFRAVYQSWERWGWIAIAAPVAAMVLMVLKPALPAL